MRCNHCYSYCPYFYSCSDSPHFHSELVDKRPWNVKYVLDLKGGVIDGESKKDDS